MGKSATLAKTIASTICDFPALCQLLSRFGKFLGGVTYKSEALHTHIRNMWTEGGSRRRTSIMGSSSRMKYWPPCTRVATCIGWLRRAPPGFNSGVHAQGFRV